MVTLGKALASPIRIRVLKVLEGRELCQCELMGVFGLAPSTMSKHMSLLVAAALVTSRKEGRWVHYSLPVQPGDEVHLALEILDLVASTDPIVMRDKGRLGRVVCH